MNISENGIKLIKQFEGCRLTAYKCPAGVWTIGYGHTKNVKTGDGITYEQAEEFLKQDIKNFETAVNKYVKTEITQNMYDAIVSFTYNVGIAAFSSSTLLKLINSGQYNLAAKQFDRWVYSKGKKLKGLVLRRKAEKELFLSRA